MDARRAPERVRLRHGANQGADRERHRGPTGTAAALPSPEATETPAVPRDDRLRLDDDERRSPTGPRAGQADPEPPVRLYETHSPRPCSLQHLQLMSQGEHLKLECGARPHGPAQALKQWKEDGHHRREAYPRSAATSTLATRTDFSAGTACYHDVIAPMYRRALDAESEATGSRPRCTVNALLNVCGRPASISATLHRQTVTDR